MKQKKTYQQPTTKFVTLATKNDIMDLELTLTSGQTTDEDAAANAYEFDEDEEPMPTYSVWD